MSISFPNILYLQTESLSKLPHYKYHFPLDFGCDADIINSNSGIESQLEVESMELTVCLADILHFLTDVSGEE